MTPKPKNDLAKLFGVEDLIQPRSPAFDTEKEFSEKTPSQMVEEVKVLMDEVTNCVNVTDLPGLILRLNAAQMRIEFMQQVANSLQKRLGNG